MNIENYINIINADILYYENKIKKYLSLIEFNLNKNNIDDIIIYKMKLQLSKYKIKYIDFFILIDIIIDISENININNINEIINLDNQLHLLLRMKLKIKKYKNEIKNKEIDNYLSNQYILNSIYLFKKLNKLLKRKINLVIEIINKIITDFQYLNENINYDSDDKESL